MNWFHGYKSSFSLCGGAHIWKWDARYTSLSQFVHVLYLTMPSEVYKLWIVFQLGCLMQTFLVGLCLCVRVLCTQSQTNRTRKKIQINCHYFFGCVTGYEYNRCNDGLLCSKICGAMERLTHEKISLNHGRLTMAWGKQWYTPSALKTQTTI